MLSILVNDRLTTVDHVNSLLSSCASLLYALRVLRSHGTPTATVHDVFRATVIARMTYCGPAWSGSCSSADRKRLDSFLTRCKRFGYCDALLPPIINSLFKEANDMFLIVLLTTANAYCSLCYQRNVIQSIIWGRGRMIGFKLISLLTWMTVTSLFVCCTSPRINLSHSCSTLAFSILL